MKSASQIMRELVAVQSDTGTTLEVNVAAKILELIKEDEYFRANPDLCGAYQDDDALGRPVVWALKRGSSARTLIISGHYDCVETQCYGPLQEYALNPDSLKNLMKENSTTDEQLRRDLEDDNWVFGRGTADMKGVGGSPLCSGVGRAARSTYCLPPLVTKRTFLPERVKQ